MDAGLIPAGMSATWQEVVLVGGVLSLVATPIIWVWRDARAGIAEVHKRVDELKDDVADFKLDAAKTFVTTEAITRVESRLVIFEERFSGSIDKLTERLDRVLESRPRSRTP